jgi:hypothetical protein
MKVTIISIWSKRHKSEPPIRYDVVARGNDVHSTLEDAFRLTNVRPTPPRVAATTPGIYCFSMVSIIWSRMRAFAN